jgi:hypothetical protein
MIIWKVSDGAIVTEKTISLDEMNALEAQVGL